MATLHAVTVRAFDAVTLIDQRLKTIHHCSNVCHENIVYLGFGYCLVYSRL